MEHAELLQELDPMAGELLERHLASAKEWFPHRYVPWERAAEIDFDAEWQPEAFPLSEAVRSALFVNLLTEDNLPYYHATIEGALTRKQQAWTAWNRRWTAEEARHAVVIRDYLTVSHAIDPVVLERARMHQMSTGVTPQLETPADLLAYASLQELATRISHRNTGKLLEDPVGFALMTRVSMDENLHFLFYRDAMSAVLEIDPSTGMLALERQVREFEMPGTGIPGFKQHSRAIANAGIYDITIHYEQILKPVVLRHFEIEDIEGLSPAAEQARDTLVKMIGRIEKVSARNTARREEREAAAEQTEA